MRSLLKLFLAILLLSINIHASSELTVGDQEGPKIPKIHASNELTVFGTIPRARSTSAIPTSECEIQQYKQQYNPTEIPHLKARRLVESRIPIVAPSLTSPAVSPTVRGKKGIQSPAKVFPSYDIATLPSLVTEAINVEVAGANRLHLDVIGGLTLEESQRLPPIYQSIKEATHIPFDIHFLFSPCNSYIEMFRSATAIFIPVAEILDLTQKLSFIKSLGCEAGVVLNPDQPLGDILPVLSVVNHVILMGVEPGMCGQTFIPSTLGKIGDLVIKRRELDLQFLIMVDGGVNPENAGLIVSLGADVLISGSSIFCALNYAKAIQALKECV